MGCGCIDEKTTSIVMWSGCIDEKTSSIVMWSGCIDEKTSSIVLWSGCIDENKTSACAMDVLMKTRVSIELRVTTISAVGSSMLANFTVCFVLFNLVELFFLYVDDKS